VRRMWKAVGSGGTAGAEAKGGLYAVADRGGGGNIGRAGGDVVVRICL
jgi:hypothetical protein